MQLTIIIIFIGAYICIKICATQLNYFIISVNTLKIRRRIYLYCTSSELYTYVCFSNYFTCHSPSSRNSNCRNKITHIIWHNVSYKRGSYTAGSNNNDLSAALYPYMYAVIYRKRRFCYTDIPRRRSAYDRCSADIYNKIINLMVLLYTTPRVVRPLPKLIIFKRLYGRSVVRI